MSWEQFLKDQADRASTLIANTISRLRATVDATSNAALTPGEFADLFAKNAILNTKDMLDFAFQPFNFASPQTPVMYFTSASGVPPTGVVRLHTDVVEATVNLTRLVLDAANAIEVAQMVRTVRQGTVLSVVVNVIPGQRGLYQGVARVANTPIAVILFERL